jgi:hypothetical protein
MNLKSIKYLSIFLLLVAFAFMEIRAEGGDKKSNTLIKVTGAPVYKKFNINRISTWIKNDGESDINPDGNSGFEYPRRSGKTAIFQSGLVWAGKVNGQIRAGGSSYRQGTVPGKILNSGVPADQLIGEDPNLANVRNYRVRPDYLTGSVQAEIDDGEGSESEVRAAYERDWMDWPAGDGAPFKDVDSNGVYDPTIDIPGVPGADQTIWFVCNDTDPEQALFLAGANPMGIEEQVTIWGYNSAGPLGSMLFRKYKLINKSDTDITDMYVTMWNDPDLGDATDDFAGCDTTLSMTFVYNANPTDAIYGDKPAASGFDFFQGPIVESPGDTAIFNGKYLPGYKNLPMTAHYFYVNPDAVWRDPTQGQYQGSLEWYNWLQGRVGTTGEIFPDPYTLGTSTFALYGDPVTGTGWVDGLLFPPGDRRAGMASGPFTMAPGDTQEVVVAEMAAIGQNNINSVTLLKSYDKVAQEAYDKFFVLPSAPTIPVVTGTALDQEVVLEWGSNLTRVAETESHNQEGFTFQGYNVYQLPDPTATKENSVRIATFDIVDGIKSVIDKKVDPISGDEITYVAQYGSDNGIERSINLTKNYLSNLPLNNGSRYYFAVTSYAIYNNSGLPDSVQVPNNLENTFIVITVVPQSTDPGVRYPAAYGDTLAGVVHIGSGDGSLVPIVIDPSLLNGNEYEVTFDTMTVEGSLETFWNLTNVTTGTVVAANQTNQTGDEAYPIVDGILFKVLGPPPGMKDWDIPQGTRRFTWAGADWGLEGFSGAIGKAYGNWFGNSTVTDADLKTVKLVLAKVDLTGNYDVNDPNVSYGYRYMRRASQPPALPEFAPFIVNPGPGYAYQDFTRSVPLTAWNMETDPPTRLAVGVFENNVPEGFVDGKYWPGSSNTTDNTVSREFLFVFGTPYSETPNPEYEIECLGNELPFMWWVAVNRRGDAEFSPGGSGEDEFLIIANHISTPEDVFSVTALSTTESSSLATEDVNQINVFPNPYYGVNSQEINKYERFVTINHLPDKATIRVFNLAGQLVRTIEKTEPGQFQRWDLTTDSGLPVASGLYIIYVDMPDLGKTKILKAAVIQEQQILDRF